METAAAHTCHLCSKSFFSAKALYGHMRWHRATEHPAAAAGESRRGGSTVMRSWGRTARRTPVFPVAVAVVVQGTTEQQYVAGADGEESVSSAISVDAVDGGSKEDAGDSGPKLQAGQVEKPPPVVSLDARPPCDDGDWCGIKESASAVCEAPAVPGQPPPPTSYHCGPCGKTFSSRQALSGHTAIHGKQNGQPEEDGGSSCGPAPKKKRRVRESATGPTSDQHRCGQCGRVFGTGQALGGHMRLHWQGPKVFFFPTTTTTAAALPLPPPPPPPAANLEEIITKSSPPPPLPVRDFDLNELPPPPAAAEDDDGGAREILASISGSTTSSQSRGHAHRCD